MLDYKAILLAADVNALRVRTGPFLFREIDQLLATDRQVPHPDAGCIKDGVAIAALTEFTNNGKAPLEVWVEPYPDRYITQPGDTLVLIEKLGFDSRGKPGLFTFNA